MERLVFSASWSGTVAALSVVLEVLLSAVALAQGGAQAECVDQSLLEVVARGWKLCTQLAAR